LLRTPGASKKLKVAKHIPFTPMSMIIDDETTNSDELICTSLRRLSQRISQEEEALLEQSIENIQLLATIQSIPSTS